MFREVLVSGVKWLAANGMTLASTQIMANAQTKADEIKEAAKLNSVLELAKIKKGKQVLVPALKTETQVHTPKANHDAAVGHFIHESVPAFYASIENKVKAKTS